MRLIHTSDWHLGRTLHGENLLPYQDSFLRWLLDEAVRQRAGAVVVAGDIYDRAVPPLDAVRLLDATLLRFAQARIPVILISGNHDSAVRLGFGAGLSEAAGIHLRTSVPDLARPVLLADEHGPVAIYGIPYLLPDAVMADLGVQARTARGGAGRGGAADPGGRRGPWRGPYRGRRARVRHRRAARRFRARHPGRRRRRRAGRPCSPGSATWPSATCTAQQAEPGRRPAARRSGTPGRRSRSRSARRTTSSRSRWPRSTPAGRVTTRRLADARAPAAARGTRQAGRPAGPGRLRSRPTWPAPGSRWC